MRFSEFLRRDYSYKYSFEYIMSYSSRIQQLHVKTSLKRWKDGVPGKEQQIDFLT